MLGVDTALTGLHCFVFYRYGFVSWWSGTIFFNQLLFLLYNFFFTSLPQIYAAVYDRPATAKTLMAVPELYSRGRLDQGYVTIPPTRAPHALDLSAHSRSPSRGLQRYTDRHFFAAVLESFVCGTVVFAIPFAVIDNTEASMLMLGQACLTLLIFVANMYVHLFPLCVRRSAEKAASSVIVPPRLHSGGCRGSRNDGLWSA